LNKENAMPTIADEMVLTEKIKAILREFHPEASESEVLDAFEALVALLEEEDDDAAEE
jgi:hypothetical protein